MAHDLVLLALAEGVQTEEQWRIPRELGCDLFQGDLFGFPLSVEAVAKLLQSRRTGSPHHGSGGAATT